MKFRRPELPLQSPVDRAIGMIRASTLPPIGEMATLLVAAQTGATLDTEIMADACERMADMAVEVGVWPEDLQELLERCEVNPVPDGLDWLTIVASLKAEESQAGQ